MRTKELLRLLNKNGITLVRHGSNHDVYYSPITEKTFPVPRHTNEIKTATLKSILRSAGLE
ncbi:MAG: type II toxin-antitoxin system HicA family toxin [Anaerofustis sp.]